MGGNKCKQTLADFVYSWLKNKNLATLMFPDMLWENSSLKKNYTWTSADGLR